VIVVNSQITLCSLFHKEMEYASLALQDFITITGLKPEFAKACFEKQQNNYAAALASFVQSLASIPKDYFLDASKISGENGKKINIQLKAIYQHARQVKSTQQCDDVAAWKTYSAPPPARAAAPVAAAPAQRNATAPPSAAAPTSSTAASPPVAQAPPKISFGFGNTAASASPSAPTTFGFGKTAPATSAAPSAAFGFGNNAAKPAASAAPSAATSGIAEAVVEQAKPVPVYAEPTHFTGPFFSMPNFWEQEVVERAPLLNLDYGFLERNRDVLKERLEKWLKGAEFYIDSPVQYVAMPDKDEYYARVIIKDAERTFFGAEHREKFYMFIYAMYFEFGSYGQAMSYLAGLCLLVLTEQQTAAILRRVAKAYIPGHWAGEAVGFATSAWVVEKIMKDEFPDVAAHFHKLNFWPDTYLQKILSGLCIHVLRFEDLFVFLDAFMKGGFIYLLKFCLSMIEHFRSHLLNVTTSERMNELYEIMRLDSRAVDRADVTKILQRAPNFPLKVGGSDLDILRSEVYQDKVAPRIARAPKTEAFEPCEVCEKNRPKWWSEEIGAVCDDCKAKNPNETYSAY
jgi:hypothetical protein